MKIRFILFLFTLIACDTSKSENKTEANQKKIDYAGWLIGTWSNKSSRGVSYEVWKRDNDSTFVGHSFSVKDGDTISMETITLLQNGEGLSYIPTVQGQNDDLPVVFTLVSIDSGRMVFENEAHDFPKNISYQKITQDSLVAEISGTINGEYRAKQFPMSRRQ